MHYPKYELVTKGPTYYKHQINVCKHAIEQLSGCNFNNRHPNMQTEYVEAWDDKDLRKLEWILDQLQRFVKLLKGETTYRGLQSVYRQKGINDKP